jgi:hypothetical protein
MKTALLILTLAAISHAQSPGRRGGNRDSYDASNSHSYSVSDWSNDWSADTIPQPVPEPSSPLAILIAAGLALIGRRHRPGRIREKRIDMRTVRFP